MAIENIPINSGTGPKVAVDLVGTDNYQVVKIMPFTDGATGAIWTGNVNVTTGTVNVIGVISASNVTVASVATGTFTVAGTPTVTASQGGTWNVATITTLLGTVAVSGGGGGAQYTQDTTGIANTATGTIILGIQSTTARALTLSATGDPGVRQIGTWNIATLTTLLGTVSVSGGGGGAQYTKDTTGAGDTATGNVMLGIQSTTARALALSASGDPGVRQVGAWAVTTLTTLLGTIAVSGTVDGIVQFAKDTTAGIDSGKGVIVLGVQATTARALALSASGDPGVRQIGTWNISAVTTGTVNVVNVLSASGVTIASVTTGTMNVVNVLSASGVTIASVTTGTMNVINVLSATGVLLGATTAGVGAFVGTAHASKWDAYVVNTTSAASAIIKTSGAHTLYITSMLVSVDVPMRVDIFSAATTKLSVYLATKGGFALPISPESPMVLNTAQSLTIQGGASGSCMGWAAGYTVT